MRLFIVLFAALLVAGFSETACAQGLDYRSLMRASDPSIHPPAGRCDECGAEIQLRRGRRGRCSGCTSAPAADPLASSNPAIPPAPRRLPPDVPPIVAPPIAPPTATPSEETSCAPCELDELKRTVEQLSERLKDLQLAAAIPGERGLQGEQGPPGERGPPGEPADMAAVTRLVAIVERLEQQQAAHAQAVQAVAVKIEQAAPAPSVNLAGIEARLAALENRPQEKPDLTAVNVRLNQLEDRLRNLSGELRIPIAALAVPAAR